MSGLKQKLENYLKNHSSKTIRNRAVAINLVVESVSHNRYTFSYLGSEWEPYRISIKFSATGINTSCSCPYDYGGLCKHQVAGISYILENEPFEYLEASTKSEPAKKLPPQNIHLPNHLLTIGHLKDLGKQTQANFTNIYRVDLKKFELGEVYTTYNDWGVVDQHFSYEPNTQILKTACSCRSGKTRLCLHVLSAMEYLVDTLGENLFHPDYLDQEIRSFVQANDLDPNENWHKYFHFYLSESGFRAVPLVEAFLPTVSAGVSELLQEWDPLTQDALRIPPDQHFQEIPTHGVGYALFLNKIEMRRSFQLVVFMAKFKKGTNVFTSSYKAMEDYNFFDEIGTLQSEEREQVWEAITLSKMLDKGLDNKALKEYKDAFWKFKEFLESRKPEDFFTTEDYRISKRNLSPLYVAQSEVGLRFTFTEHGDLYTLAPRITLEGRSYKLSTNRIHIYPYGCIKDQTLYTYKSPFEYQYIVRFKGHKEVHFPKKDPNEIYDQLLKPLMAHFEVDIKTMSWTKQTKVSLETAKQLFLSDYEGKYILFKPGISYQGQLIMVYSKEMVYNQANNTLGSRDLGLESGFVEELQNLHPDFAKQAPPFYLLPYQLVENDWLLRTSQKLEQLGIEVFGAKDLKSFKYSLHKPVVSYGINSNSDWFDLDIGIRYGKEQLSLKDIQKALLNKSKYVRLKDGSLGVLPEAWLKKFSNYFKAGEIKENRVRLSTYQFNVLDELFDNLETEQESLLELQRKKNKLKNLKQVNIPSLPKSLKADLRPYQKEGLRWLVFLYQNRLGGWLADDMGLGKTLQALALLAHVKQQEQKHLTHLIVVPTSLIFNWQEEIRKFCPSFTSLAYTGNKRKEIAANITEFDIVLTTYGTVMRDLEFLITKDFDYLILDESQNIKNPNSKRYKAVRLLKSKNRLALTGTPIENNTFDLYAQMNFLNPGILGGIKHFKTQFSEPIDKGGDTETSELLGRIINPFLLRRTKKQVATDLPEKTETVLYCDMDTEQRKVYETFKQKYRDYLLDKIVEQGVKKSQMYVLEGLTKLRQICNSPELLGEDADYGKKSVKLDVLMGSLKEKVGIHKVLVFSQFTSMLGLIKDRLDNENISYVYLDGRTRNRAQKVADFQENEQYRVFLISLKAGGVGLNLTQADYVFLVDPWWNPAVESQAIDRSYRIGQDKHVFAYKMVCKDTIEEKIIRLQEKKKQVSESIIDVEGHNKGFTEKDIAYLFE